jgi:hypothetical protein
VSSNSDGSQLMITLIKRAFLYEIFSSCSDDMVRYNQFFFFFLNIVTRCQHCTYRFVLGLLNRFFINCDRDMAQVLCKHAMKIAAIGNVRLKKQKGALRLTSYDAEQLL